MSIKSEKFTRWYCALLILMDFMGLTITIVIFPKLLLSNTDGILPLTLSYSSKFALMGILLALYPLGQFFGATLFGKLSDHWGRKKTLLLTLFATFCAFMLTALSISEGLIVLLFLSRFFGGLFAGNVSIAQASLVDISTETTKAHNLSFGQTAMGAAWIFGPILGAYLSEPSLISWFNYATPFWVFCFIFFIFIILTIFFFTDTLAQHHKTKINLIEGLQQVLEGFSQKQYRSIIFVWFVFVFGWWLFEAFMPAYLFKHFNFSTLQIGHLLTFNGLLFVLSQALIVSKVAKKVKPESLVKFAAVFASLGMISLAYVPSSLIYFSMGIFVLGMSFSLTGFITSLSNKENESSQGKIMGIVNSTQAFATVLVMIVGGFINSFQDDINIIGGGMITLLAWCMYLIVFRKAK